jgi:hypothetical protein
MIAVRASGEALETSIASMQSAPKTVDLPDSAYHRGCYEA